MLSVVNICEFISVWYKWLSRQFSKILYASLFKNSAHSYGEKHSENGSILINKLLAISLLIDLSPFSVQHLLLEYEVC